MTKNEWIATVKNSTGDTVAASSSNSDTHGDDFVWGLKLDGLDDGEYRLEVRLLIEFLAGVYSVCSGVWGGGGEGGGGGGEGVCY